jgi:glycosyltransferase involved in cell wall biosynthesis
VDFSVLRASLGLGPAQRVILSPKILQRLYRVHLLVEAMPLIVRQIPEAVLLVTEYRADPDYRADIAKRVHELELGHHVIFCGSVRHEDMPLYYSLAELTVAVPSSDGLPQTLFEGMACETPSILSKLPRYEEIVRHEHSAYFVEATPAGIAAGVVNLLQNENLRAEIARNALEIVFREASLEEQRQRVVQRYRQLITTVPRRAFDPFRVWSAWRGFRASNTATRRTGKSPGPR